MHPLWKIFVLVALLVGGTLLATLGITVVALVQGLDLAEFMGSAMSGEADLPSSLLRAMLWLQAIAGFLLPSLVFIYLFHRQNWRTALGLGNAPALRIAFFSVVALFAAFPLVQLAYELNTMIPLPGWMTEMEANTAEIMQDILRMESVSGYLITLLLVAVLPGIGEELVFRGILQNQLAEWFRNPVVAVWVAAIIFSGFHMQFEGFLPRLVLGALLGYLYLWTRNLWVPIVVHAFNNGLQVSVLYFSGIDLSDMEQEPAMPSSIWLVLLSAVVFFLCYRLLTQRKQQHEAS